MNPRSFANTQGVLGDEEPEIVDMSLEDSPASPEEAGANARSPSPTPDSPDYEPGEEVDMLLDAAKAAGTREGSPPYVAPCSRSPSPSALSALYRQVRGAGPRTPDTPENLERGRRSREEEGRRRARARLLLDQKRVGTESTGGRTAMETDGGPQQRPQRRAPNAGQKDAAPRQGEPGGQRLAGIDMATSHHSSRQADGRHGGGPKGRDLRGGRPQWRSCPLH